MKTQVLEVHREYPEIDKIAKCAKVIRDGGLVVFPTETVYGIAADCSNPKAIKKLREVKRRSEGKPFSVLVSQKSLITNYTSDLNPVVYKLIDRYWPGPLTVVVPTSDGTDTVGIRMPNNLIALNLIQESQCTIAAPSANFEGNNPPRTLQDALVDLDGLVEMAIDGGPADIGTGSTVVDCTKEEPSIIREGVLSEEEIRKEAAKRTILFVCTGNSCRSVMAEYLLRDMTKDRDDVSIESAGTGVFLQSTASADTISVLGELAIDATEHYSQPVNSVLLKKSDLIFVMTQSHRSQVLERVPEVEKRVYLLKEFANIPSDSLASFDIPDPIGRSFSEYKECLAVIREAVVKIVDLI